MADLNLPPPALLDARDHQAEGAPLLLSCANAPLARSLLFEHAMRRAQAGDTVLFACASQAALEQAQFARPGLHGESDAALGRIQIKYVGTDVRLRELLASFHLIAPPTPRLLLIDNLHAFFALDCVAADKPTADKQFDSHGTRERMSLTFALALSAAEYMAQEAGGSACRLVVSIVEHAPPAAGSTELAVRRHFFRRRMRAHGPLGGPPSAHMGVYAIEEVGFAEPLHAWLATAAELGDPAQVQIAPAAGGSDLALVQIDGDRAAQLSSPQGSRT